SPGVRRLGRQGRRGRLPVGRRAGPSTQPPTGSRRRGARRGVVPPAAPVLRAWTGGPRDPMTPTAGPARRASPYRPGPRGGPGRYGDRQRRDRARPVLTFTFEAVAFATA